MPFHAALLGKIALSIADFLEKGNRKGRMPVPYHICQLCLVCERNTSEARKEKTTAAETPALAAESEPVSA